VPIVVLGGGGRRVLGQPALDYAVHDAVDLPAASRRRPCRSSAGECFPTAPSGGVNFAAVR
jgi:hypothetical protein